MEEEKDKIIAQQSEVISKMVKLQLLQQGLVQKLVDALRLYMLDITALGVATALPPDVNPKDPFKMHIVKKDEEPN